MMPHDIVVPLLNCSCMIMYNAMYHRTYDVNVVDDSLDVFDNIE